MDRRRFLQLLGVAPLAFNAHRVYFDMGRRLWMSAQWGDPLIDIAQPDPTTLLINQLDAITQRFFDAGIVNTFNVDPLWLHELRIEQETPLTLRKPVTHNTTL